MINMVFANEKTCRRHLLSGFGYILGMALVFGAIPNNAQADVSFGYEPTRIHTIAVNGVNLLNPTRTGGGVYLIGSKSGNDDPSSNYISVGTNGSLMTNGGPTYRLKFWQKNATTLGFQAEVGPISSSQVNPATGKLARISLPFDFRKEVFSQFAFNGSKYYLNNSASGTNYASGSQVNYTSIPTPFPIRQNPGGPIIGYTGVAITKQATSWGELTGPLATLRVNVLNSTNYRTMEFYNHFGTNNIELQFGPLAIGQRASVDGEIIVIQRQAPNSWIFQAETHLSHGIGQRDGDGWSVRVGNTPGQYMSYGPYTTSITQGNRTATFRLMVDNNTAINNRILTIEVFDANTGRRVADRNIARREFTGAMQYQDFNLNFPATSGQRLEFRTFWHGGSYVRQDYVSVR